MALDSTNVVAGITGAVYVAPYGSAAPVDYATALNAAFKDVGYIGENGVTLDPNETVTKRAAWQNGETVKVIRKGQDITVRFEMIELRSEDAQSAYWGEGATVASGGGTVTVTDLSGSTPVALVLEVQDGDVGTRYYFPKATLADRGAIQVVSDNYQSMPVTYEAAKDTVFASIWHSA